MKSLTIVLLLTASLWANISINHASKKELTQLKGIGAKTADAIITKRPYKSIDQLLNVKGIGKKKFANIKKEVEL